ncbi:MAG: hypothetical protein ACYDBP_08065 [Leptospirales bacterium]
MVGKPPLVRETDVSKEGDAAARELFLALRTSFYQELARLLRMRTDMSLSDLIAVLESTGKYPRSILQDIAKKLREGEASFSVAIREYAPIRDSVILNLSDKRACPLESTLSFLVDFPE